MRRIVPEINIILGPPGTGKTENLLRIVDRELKNKTADSNEIGFFSFTTKATNEARDRAKAKFSLTNDDLPYFCTLHAFGKRQLGMAKTEIMNPKDYKSFSAESGVDLEFVTQDWEDTGIITTDNKLLREITKCRNQCMELEEFYNKHNGLFEIDKECEFIESPAEDVDFEQYKDKFDTVFTSPPYFSVERYSYEDTQSWVRYKEIDDWNENFLQKTIKNLWVSIKSGGYLLVNIADVFARTAGQRNMVEICNPMNDFLSTFSDSEYQGCIGMEMAKRPNSGGAGMAKASDERFQDTTIQRAEETKDKRFCEPIWIWKKL